MLLCWDWTATSIGYKPGLSEQESHDARYLVAWNYNIRNEINK